MKRREFLRAGCALTGLAFLGAAREEPPGMVMTVRGRMPAHALGFTLTHEHALVDFAGAAQTRPADYDLDEAYRIILPHLERIRALGCRSFVDCTPAYIGRSPRLLRRLAEGADLQILTNTGYYGAAGDKFLPSHAYTETASELADRWTAEWENGIDGTDIRPGFIKIGVDTGPLSDVDRNLVKAAARTHLRTGLTILSHTGPQVPAFAQLDVLRAEGVDASAWVWTHAQNEADDTALLRAAQRGAWIALDGIRADRTGFYVTRLEGFRRRNLLGRVLLSHDAGWYSPGEPGGGTFRSYDALMVSLVPALRAAGFTAGELRDLTVGNPARAFTVRKRPRREQGSAPRGEG